MTKFNGVKELAFLIVFSISFGYLLYHEQAGPLNSFLLICGLLVFFNFFTFSRQLPNGETEHF